MQSFFTSILVLLSFSFTYPQWTNQNPVPDGNHLKSVFFINDDIGWIAGHDGFIIKTTNAGLDWIQQNAGTTAWFRSLKFADVNTGWAVGNNGVIYKSTDGGISWFPQNSGITNTLYSVEVYSNEIAWASGDNGTLIKTTDGGSTWVSLTSGTSSPLYSIRFVNDLTGWTVGGENIMGSGGDIILKTTDGGDTWISQSSGSFSALYAVDFIDENTGWAVGFQDIIIKTTDGGNNWFTQYFRILDNPQEFAYGLSCVFFKDANNGWAAGGEIGGLYSKYLKSTTNGGATWENKYVGFYDAYPDLVFYSLFVTPGGNGWAVGGGGLIFISEDVGQTWQKQFSGKAPYLSDHIYGMYFTDETTGWAVGEQSNVEFEQSVIFKTTNAGKIWKENYSTGWAPPLTSVFFIDEFTGWAGGGGEHQFFYTTDGGENWTETNLNFNCKSIFFVDHNTGFATGSGIWKSTDGGINWIEKSSADGNSIYFADAIMGWAAGNGGSIRKSTDGGETWISKTSGTTANLNSIKFYDSYFGMCVGSNGTVLISVDGGESWSAKNSGTTNNLNSVTFTNLLTAWAAGDNGTILTTTNLGNTWSFFNEETNNSLNSVFFVNENTGWVGGLNGTLLKYYIESNITLTLTAPNGGQWWKTGWNRDITWSSENVSNVNLYYSSDNGSNWNPIASNIAANTGSYEWEIPLLSYFISPHCKVKIEDASNSNIYDVSDNPFIIWHPWGVVKTCNLGQQLVDFLETNIDISLNVTTGGDITVTYYPGETPVTGTLPSGIVVISDYYWQVTTPDVSFDNGKMITPISTLRGVTDATKLVWLKRTNSGDPWENIGGIVYGDNLESTVLFNSFSEFAIGSTDPVNPLPVELYYFEASVSGSSVNLKWKTKTEVENYGFEVERCLDNSWEGIGFVQGYGNSNSPKTYSFIDDSPFGGSKFNYRLKQLDTDGEFEYSKVVEVELVPTKFALFQNYPNPFNPSTKIRYQLPQETKVVIKIYDILGIEAATLVNEKKEPGTYEVELNSSSLSSGTYIYRIVAGDFVETKKMVLMK